MTIGRGAECALRLADPQKHISRVHAVIDRQGARHVLTVLSRLNPVLLNGARIGPSESADVKADDLIELGHFAIRLLELHKEAPTPGASPARQVAASPFDFGLGRSDTLPGDDPFRALDDLVPAKPSAKPVAPGPDPFELPLAKHPRANPDAVVDGIGGISHQDLGHANESIGPLAKLLTGGEAPMREVDGPTFNLQPLGTPALDDILGRGSGNPAGEPLVDLSTRHPGGSSNVDHVQPVNVAFNAPAIRGEPRRSAAQPARGAPPPAARPAPPADPFEGFDPFGSLLKGRAAEAQPAVAPAKRDVPRPAAPVAVPAAPSAPLARPGRALAAFLEGAGLQSLEISDAEAEAFMRESGAIMRAAVEGLIGLLIARSELKKEMRAEDRTMVASRDNNPLKLMTDSGEAMRFLFDARERVSGAFLPPVQAVRDACGDLRVHDIALMAGMRAAFQGALKRFAPQYIEREVDKQNGSFTLNKKVKLWEAFVAYHEKLSRDAEDDLLKVFGREFVATYMAQVRRFTAGR